MSRTYAPRPGPRPRTFAAVLTVALAVTFAGALAGPAYAEKYVSKDAKRDAVSFTFESEDQTAAPDNATADIVRVKVNHARGAIRFRAKLRDLSGPSLTLVGAEIKTNQKRYSLIFTRTGKRTSLDLTTATGKAIKCAGMQRSSDVDTDVVKFSVPRTCLDRPRWVRAGVGCAVVDEEVVFADDALREGDLKASGNLTLTERLKRG